VDLFDLGDLVLSSSLDWSVKLWKVRAPAATSTTGITGEGQFVTPILDFTREDVVYDAAWSPVKPGVFSLVDGAGNLEVWDITVDTEVPLAKIAPSIRAGGRSAMSKSLNKLAWEELKGSASQLEVLMALSLSLKSGQILEERIAQGTMSGLVSRSWLRDLRAA